MGLTTIYIPRYYNSLIENNYERIEDIKEKVRRWELQEINISYSALLLSVGSNKLFDFLFNR